MIYGRHSVLKRGCSTWNEDLAPREEFQNRLDVIRREMARLSIDGLLIYDDNYCFADLCYVTNYFPKVRGGIAVVPCDGAVSMLLNIGSRDVPFAKTLTWVDDVRASNLIGADGAKMLEEKGLHRGKVGLADSGRGFPLPQLEEMKAALPEVQWTACDALVAVLRLQKSSRELVAMRAAGRLLSAICNEAESYISPGKKACEIVAEIDRLARNKGAEDIRILGGEGHLQPPSVKQTETVNDHWALYVAVQHERYWAEAGRTYILSDHETVKRTYIKAQEVVQRMSESLKPGNSVAAIDSIARQELGEFYAGAAQYGLGQGIGLNQWEAPFFSAGEASEVGAPAVEAVTLNAGMTLALRVAFRSEGKLVIYGNSYAVTSSGQRSLL
ncbi:MAG TPA: M24 family metallopeptidase [Candidatus Binatia bacterium]|nr:M24 family metallopeptidase [Candidatus Binatia bacterium]